ncbi:hypothetical protein QWJ07_17045 [Frankia sp. RB7]|nr:hypothetical protein [Frankia sp. RB7]
MFSIGTAAPWVTTKNLRLLSLHIVVELFAVAGDGVAGSPDKKIAYRDRSDLLEIVRSLISNHH